MKRRSFLAALAPIIALVAPVVAQTQVSPAPVVPETPKARSATPGAAGTTANPATAAAGAAGAPADKAPKRPKGPTEITAAEAMLDNKANLAVFSGEVDVKAPDYTVNCDKLTVYLKKNQPKTPEVKVAEPGPIGEDPNDPKPGAPKTTAPAAPGAAGTPPGVAGAAPGAPGAATGAPAAKPDDKSDSGNAIDTAIAEGNVKILQIKVTEPGQPPEKYYGVGKKAVFDNLKQTCTLTGWPRVQQTVNGALSKEIISLEEGCVIVMNADRIDVSHGRHITRIIDESALSGDQGKGTTPAGTTPGAAKPAGAKGATAPAAPATPGAAAPADSGAPSLFRANPTHGGIEGAPR